MILVNDDYCVQTSVHEHPAHVVHLLPFPLFLQKHGLLVGFFGQGVGDDKEGLGHTAELPFFHEGHLFHGLAVFLGGDPDGPRIAEHCVLVIQAGAHLPDEPVGDMSSTHGDAHARVPQSAAHAATYVRAIRIVSSKEGVGAHAVFKSRPGSTDDLAA